MCHGSVGLVARELEARGIATVCIFVEAFAHVAGRLRLPRVLLTPHLMGRTVGPVGDRTRQAAVVRAALDLLVTAEGPETVRRVGPRSTPGSMARSALPSTPRRAPPTVGSDPEMEAMACPHRSS